MTAGGDQPLVPGAVVWVDLAPTRGREQSGHRPALVVNGSAYLGLVTTLVMVVPITSVDRGWPNHVAVGEALPRPSWAMTEQIRTVSRDRITGIAGSVPPAALAEARRWLTDFLELEAL